MAKQVRAHENDLSSTCTGKHGQENFFTQTNGFTNGLAALQHCWENRITGKDLRAIGESYSNGRISIALDFGLSSLVSKQIDLPAGIDPNIRKTHLIVVLFVHDTDILEFCEIDRRGDQVMFVNIVDFPDLPDKHTASTVRFYLVQDSFLELGAGLSYSTICWRFLSSFSGLEGGLKIFPSFVARKSSPASFANGDFHYCAGNVVEGAIEIVETISNGQRQVGWDLVGNCAKSLRSGIGVRILNNTAEVTLSEGLQNSLNLLEVAVGPIDL